MSICFDESRGTVHLTNGSISYVMQLLDGRYLLHRYFGPALRRWRGTGVPQPAKRSYTTEYGDPHLYFAVGISCGRPGRLPSPRFCGDRRYRRTGIRVGLPQLADSGRKAGVCRAAGDLCGGRGERNSGGGLFRRSHGCHLDSLLHDFCRCGCHRPAAADCQHRSDTGAHHQPAKCFPLSACRIL